MNLKNSLVSGTIILTLSGLLSRVIGFFYRIYLSQHFGEEGMGIYQLTGPILGLTYALCISGIQSAIAKQIAEKNSKKVINSLFRLGYGYDMIKDAIYKVKEEIADELYGNE